MSGNRLLLDTNIILYLLSGDETLANILDKKHNYISFITELELYSFKLLTKLEKQKIDAVLSACTIIDINAGIKRHAIAFRQSHSLKLPDSIIAGTSMYLDIPLITSDKAFNKVDDLGLIFYEYEK